ncbi:MAG: hypothetical protein ACSLFK_14680 [Gemmatimonadaceae bacterium]
MRKALVIAVPFVIAACAEPTSVSTPSYDFGLRTVWSSETPSVVVPAGYDAIMGASNNQFPHSVANARYQQVFQGADLSDPILVGLCLRRDEQLGGTERTQRLTIKLGPTSLDYTNLGMTFDANYNTSVPPTTVFSGDVLVPINLAGGIITDFDLCIPFTQSYEHVPGTNVILEVVNTSEVSGFTPKDACTSAEAACTTARVYARTADATTALPRESRGLILKFISPEPVRPIEPVEKDECLKGGWANFSFKNQGQCVRFIETGVDSRTEAAL